MMESMSRFGRGISRHPIPPIPHSEDSETDEYNVIDSDRQYERIGDRGSSSTGTSSSRSSNQGALVDPLILHNGGGTLGNHNLHSAHPSAMFHPHKAGTLGKSHHHQPHQLTTHYAESAIYRRSRGGNGSNGGILGSPVDAEPPLIPESQLFMSGSASGVVNGGNSTTILDGGWKSQHSTLEFGHLNQLHQQQQQQQHQQQQHSAAQNTTMLSTLDSTTNVSNATTTTSVHAGNMAPIYESTCLMRTASGSLYIPSDNKGAFLAPKPMQSINEFTIGGTLKKPDRLPQVGANHHSHFGRPLGSHLTGSRFAFRKVLSLQCNWKYIAIAFMLLTMALIIAITYIMSSALSAASLAQSTNCPVMVDDILELTQPPQQMTGSGNGHSAINPFLQLGPKKATSSHHHVPSASGSAAPFTNIQQIGRTYSQRVSPQGYWHLRYHQAEAGLVKFNVSFPSAIAMASAPVLAIYGNRDKLATHTRYDFVEFVGRVAVATGGPRSKRANDVTYQGGHHMKVTSIQKEFTKYLDSGVWFFTFFNDAPSHVDVSLDLTMAAEELCPFNCRGHGVCIAGQCKCDTGYNGESCDLMTCPVLCSGRGQYLNGECVCNSGWKGKECNLRDDECEIANCNGHGDCVDGSCHCFPGYKGEHCEHVDCLDPKCSGHGHCMSGVCMCGKGWKGADCSEPDTEAMHCLPDCSGHGNFDLQLQQCICDERWTGSDCSQERCDLDCGTNGHCEGGECICDEGWSGQKCMTRLCDPRCLEHGQCQNGTCLCTKGWNGRHCSLEGCANGCSGHGECNRQASELADQEEWACTCENGFSGLDCSVQLESNCGDNIDNDKDGLVDCADPECCQSKECEGKQLCFSASDPQDILLRKQPPAMTASFYQRMQFLIEEESTQSYAEKFAFNDR